MTVCVVGHSNPDTDSVTAAIAYAALLNAQGTDAKACMQTEADELNPESKLVLDRFGLAAPEDISDAAGKKVALVDFSELVRDQQILAKLRLLQLLIIIKLVMLRPTIRFCSGPSLLVAPVLF